MATLLKSENFSGGTYDTGYWTAVESYFTADHYTPSNSEPKYVTSSPAPAIDGYALHYFIKSGTNEAVPCRIQKEATWSEFYVEFYIYFKSTFTYPSGIKIFRAGNTAGGGNVFFFEYNYGSPTREVIFYTFDFPGSVEVTRNYSYNIPEDEWVKVGLYFKESTPSTSNGTFRIWFNDVLGAEAVNVVTRTTSLDKNYFWLGGNNTWNGNNAAVVYSANADSHLYFSNIKVYDGMPSSVSPKLTLKKASAGQRAGQSSGQF